jgi:hypothetical protein
VLRLFAVSGTPHRESRFFCEPGPTGTAGQVSKKEAGEVLNGALGAAVDLFDPARTVLFNNFSAALALSRERRER